jgi:hypothetical protein
MSPDNDGIGSFLLKKLLLRLYIIRRLLADILAFPWIFLLDKRTVQYDIISEKYP